MNTLEKLVELAGKHAHTVLIDLHQSIIPTWAMVDAQGRMSIVGTPWGDEAEKALMVATMRVGMRAKGIVAYSLVTEAWAASAPEGWKEGDPHIESRLRPDRKEIVIAVATDGKEVKWGQWLMHRDWNERVVKLEPKSIEEGSASSWMTELLSKRGTPQS